MFCCPEGSHMANLAAEDARKYSIVDSAQLIIWKRDGWIDVSIKVNIFNPLFSEKGDRAIKGQRFQLTPVLVILTGLSLQHYSHILAEVSSTAEPKTMTCVRLLGREP